MKRLFSRIRSFISANAEKECPKFPFAALPDTYTITCRHILENGDTILYVAHDDDGMWQFLCGRNHTGDEARVVSLGEIFARDNTLADIACMPGGYIAERRDLFSEWHIKER